MMLPSGASAKLNSETGEEGYGEGGKESARKRCSSKTVSGGKGREVAKK